MKIRIAFALALITAVPSIAAPLVDDHSTNATATNVNAPVTANTNTNANANVNTATGGNAAAGVAFSGNSNVDVDNKASVKNSGNSFNVNANDQAQRQKQGQAQLQNQSVDGSGNSSNSIAINNPRQPVSTAVAASLTSSVEACMGSTSIGGQGVGFGLSIGTTWENDACQARMDARTLTGLGYQDAARARLCASEGIREAFKASGSPCPQDAPQTPVAAVAPAPQKAAFLPMEPVPND